MAGYREFSKSNNAVDAEANGRYPASRIAKILGIPVEFVVKHAPHGGEWHHSSKFYNVVDYYDLQQVKDWLAGAGDYAVEGNEPTGNPRRRDSKRFQSRQRPARQQCRPRPQDLKHLTRA